MRRILPALVVLAACSGPAGAVKLPTTRAKKAEPKPAPPA